MTPLFSAIDYVSQLAAMKTIEKKVAKERVHGNTWLYMAIHGNTW